MPKHDTLTIEEHNAIVHQAYPDYPCVECKSQDCQHYKKCTHWREWLSRTWCGFNRKRNKNSQNEGAHNE